MRVELIQKIINSQNSKELHRRLAFLIRNRHCILKRKYHEEIFKDFMCHLEYLTTRVYYPEYIPRTNNEIENLIRQLNLRLKTIGRFNHYKYASDYLNVWALMRRFTPFTDCRKPNRHRNGKAPLELAGCNIQGRYNQCFLRLKHRNEYMPKKIGENPLLPNKQQNISNQ